MSLERDESRTAGLTSRLENVNVPADDSPGLGAMEVRAKEACGEGLHDEWNLTATDEAVAA
jgi:hypothetical protein